VPGQSGQATHPLQAALGDVLVTLKQLAQVHGLSAPEVAVDAPVERELEGPPVEASAGGSARASSQREADSGTHRT